MRVICIDDSGLSTFGCIGFLKEGEIYTASKCPDYEDCYCLSEIPFNEKGMLISYGKRRFIPLSSIDETQMTRENIKELTSIQNYE